MTAECSTKRPPAADDGDLALALRRNRQASAGVLASLALIWPSAREVPTVKRLVFESILSLADLRLERDELEANAAPELNGKGVERGRTAGQRTVGSPHNQMIADSPRATA